MMNRLQNVLKPIHFYSAIVSLILISSCSSSKAIMTTREANSKLSAKQVIKQHQKNNAGFKTMQAKLRVDITDGDKEQGMTFTFRMEKDKVIWLSAPLGLARMMLTPNKVQYYNKTDNSYFDGDYVLLSAVAGVELDFQKVQNIVLGQAVFDLKEPHTVSVNNNAYALAPKKQDLLIELFYLINPSHFKMNSLQMFQNLQKRFLKVDYITYQNINKEVIPKGIKIIAAEDADEVRVLLEIKSVALDGDVRFPFNMPSGYKEIVIK